MSLNVYLEVETSSKVQRGSGIFIREGGMTKEITRQKWDARNPDREPVVFSGGDSESNEVFDYNITHNLVDMAEAAGIYKHLWRPEELGITKAAQLIEPLRQALAELKAYPEKFKTFNPSNGWGDYEGLVQFVASYLMACEENPEATVRVSR